MTEEEVFLAALDIADPAARAAFLDRACGGDATLRTGVEGLLAAHLRTGAFLGDALYRPAAGAPTPALDNTVSLHTDPEGAAVAGGNDRDDRDTDLGFLRPSARPDSLGRIGHYEALEVLGRGGFGVVFRAFDDVLQRVVALKVLAPAVAATSPARKRFLREARSSAKVRHENVVQVYDVAELPLPYIVMEFIPGETLQQRLDRTGPLEAAEIVRLGRQIAEGLAAAHATGLVHRDVKPGNVLIETGARERVKLTDFGLARAADDASLTQSGVLAGTPMYMAPEQAQGGTLDHRADLFSLGSVLYALAAGRPPFRAATTFAVLKRVVEDNPRPLREVIPELPRWLVEVIARLHAKNPADRFQTAREVADLLGECEARLHTNTRTADFPRVAPTAANRTGRWKWGAAALLLPALALVGTEGTGVTHWVRNPPPVTGDRPPEPSPVPGVAAVAPQPAPVPPKAVEPPAQPQPADSPPWVVLRPVEMKSDGGATLTLQKDGSVLAGGTHPEQDVYTLTARDLPARITALRLDVLPHESLPQNGPGRRDNGEFVLTTIRVHLVPPGFPAEPRELKLARAAADNSRGVDSLVHFAIDNTDMTGWVTEVGQPHYAEFGFAEPVAVPPGAVLRVVLEFKHEDFHHSLGCFRLSANPGR